VLKYRLLAAVDSVVSCCAHGRIEELGGASERVVFKFRLLAAVDSVVSCCACGRIKKLGGASYKFFGSFILNISVLAMWDVGGAGVNEK
jgi:hypothetical protein